MLEFEILNLTVEGSEFGWERRKPSGRESGAMAKLGSEMAQRPVNGEDTNCQWSVFNQLLSNCS